MKNNGNFLLGLILIIVGGLWIAGTLGIIEVSMLFIFLKFWPVLLILAGINIIFKGNKGVVLLSALIIITGGIYLAQHDDFNGISFLDWTYENKQNWDDEPITILEDSYDLESIESATLNLNVGAAHIDIDSIIGNKMKYSIPDYYLSRTYNTKGTHATIMIKHNKSFKINAFGNNNNLDYKFYLPEDIKWIIELDAGASEAKLNLSNLIVDNVSIDTGASDIALIIGDKNDHTTIDISTGVSDVNLSINKNSGVRIDSDQAISDNNFESQGLIKIDGYYESKNYDKADKKVEIKIDSAISNMNLDFY